MRFGQILKLLETKGLFHFLSINLSGKMKIKLPIFVTLAYFYRQFLALWTSSFLKFHKK